MVSTKTLKFNLLLIFCVCCFSWTVNSKKNVTSKNSTSDATPVLLTDNTNHYLCDANVVLSASQDDDEYAFACTQGGDLECPTDYVIDCLIYASYGNTAGSCSELTENPYGCGFTATVSCKDSYECTGDHGGEIDECFDTMTHSNIETSNPCTDCLPMCGCSQDLYNAPQFYNVADCFGDRNSNACNSENPMLDNVFLPQNLYHRLCYQQQSCYIGLTGNELTCTSDDGQQETYYNSAFVSNNDNPQGQTEEFENYQSVIEEGIAVQCTPAKLKILALCAKN